MNAEIIELINQISDESKKAAIKKAEELKFDLNKGQIPLNESLHNLETSTNLIKAAIEKEKLTHLPLSLQGQIKTDLTKIIEFLTGMAGGTDQIINLVNQIESLYSKIWTYNLYNLDSEVFQFKEKLNGIKNQELEIKKILESLKEYESLKEGIVKLKKDAENNVQGLKTNLDSSTQLAEKIKSILAESTDSQQKVDAILKTVEQNDKTAKDLVSTAKSSHSEIKAVEKQSKDFFAKVQEFEAKIETVSKTATTNVKANKEETDKLIGDLRGLENQIKDQLEKATGFSLFHSFQTRQGKLEGSKKFWLGTLAILVCLSLGLTYWIATATTQFDVAFFLKLSLSLPLIFAIAFSSVQYSRERKLEEEYAFKSNISISLVPYKDLVEKLITKDEQNQKSEYTKFIIDSINKVFTSPVSKVMDGDGDVTLDPQKYSEKAGKSLEALLKPLTPLLKILGK